MLKISENEHRIVVGITQGDINGIGYEVIIKTCLDPRITELFVPVVYGLSKVASYHRKLVNIPDFSFNPIRHLGEISPKKANLVSLSESEVKVDQGQVTAKAGEMALLSLEAAVKDLKAGAIDVLVTAPLNKKAVQEHTQAPFSGHTAWLAAALSAPAPLMLMVCPKLKVALATEHIPLENVAKSITTELLVKKAEMLHHTLRRDFGIRSPRIAMLGLNPHAGEEGLLGKEETEVIVPAIKQLQQKNLLVYGPYPADGFFGQEHGKNFDAVLAMYHDQGLIPFKALSQGEGVNYTAGLPYVRTSPAHGTAFDIVGKDVASPDSFRAAIYLACDIYRNRKTWDEINANPLGYSKKSKDE